MNYTSTEIEEKQLIVTGKFYGWFVADVWINFNQKEQICSQR